MAAPFADRAADWLSVEDALSRVLDGAVPLPAVGRAPDAADGLVLAGEVAATATLPPHDNSAMDGYAVRADDLGGATPDTPVRLRVIGHALPGPPTPLVVGVGEAVRITTGAPVPGGADSVVRVEHTDREAMEGVVEVRDPGDAGRNVRPAGRDLRVGDVVARAGDVLLPGLVGIVSAAAVDEVRVHPRPDVTLLTTGDELAGLDALDRVRSGDAIPDTNGPMLAAAVRAAGGVPRREPPAPDDLDALVARLERARETDLLVTVGGASMGTGDLVKRALDRLGFELDFWRVQMRPGSPFGFGRLPRGGRSPLPVCSLPGNPASAFVTFELFVRPLVRRLAGHPDLFRTSVVALAAESLPAHPRLTLFPRVVLESDDAGFPHLRSAGEQNSGLVHTLARAHGLAVVPPTEGEVAAGTPLRVLLLDDGPAGAREPEWLASALAEAEMP